MSSDADHTTGIFYVGVTRDVLYDRVLSCATTKQSNESKLQKVLAALGWTGSYQIVTFGSPCPLVRNLWKAMNKSRTLNSSEEVLQGWREDTLKEKPEVKLLFSSEFKSIWRSEVKTRGGPESSLKRASSADPCYTKDLISTNNQHWN
jgi:hypothetical protein